MTGGDRAADAAAIAAATAELDRALVAGPPAAVAALFAVAAVLGESGLADLVGRAAIERFLAEANRLRTVTGHRVTREELVFVTADRAIEYGRFEEAKTRPGEPGVIHERGRTVTDWRRDPDGRWRIARLFVSDLPSPRNDP
jgi:ketosteroid isomerase-like protein